MTGSTDNHDESAFDGDACRRFRVTGHVQGVFFRSSTQTAALDLGLTGYAINKPDGSVEVLACGSMSSLDKLEAWLHDGPPMAQVNEVLATPDEFRDLDGFTTG